MAVKYKHSEEFTTYFVTFTCHKWKPLFEITNSYDSVYNWFSILKNDSIDIIGFVIMPKHVHTIIHFPSPGYNLNKIMSNAKRFMAYEIVNRLKNSDNGKMLQDLASDLTEREKIKGQKHKVFKDSFDAKALYSDKFLFQKLDYIHGNPVNGKWTLSKDNVSYEHSSASFYETGEVKHFSPKHYKEL
jgi:putative transposase